MKNFLNIFKTRGVMMVRRQVLVWLITVLYVISLTGCTNKEKQKTHAPSPQGKIEAHEEYSHIPDENNKSMDQPVLQWKTRTIKIDCDFLDDVTAPPVIQLLTYESFCSACEKISLMKNEYYEEYGEDISAVGEGIEEIFYPESYFKSGSLAMITLRADGTLSNFAVTEVQYHDGRLTVVLERQFYPIGWSAVSAFSCYCIFLEINEVFPVATEITIEFDDKDVIVDKNLCS